MDKKRYRFKIRADEMEVGQVCWTRKPVATCTHEEGSIMRMPSNEGDSVLILWGEEWCDHYMTNPETRRSSIKLDAEVWAEREPSKAMSRAAKMRAQLQSTAEELGLDIVYVDGAARLATRPEDKEAAPTATLTSSEEDPDEQENE